jgi:hypothetical protein
VTTNGPTACRSAIARVRNCRLLTTTLHRSLAAGPQKTGVLERCGNRDKTARYREKQRV